MDSIDKLYSEEAERSLMGAILVEPSLIGEALDIISHNDFFRPQNRVLFETCAGLFTQGLPVDVVTIREKLGDRLDFVGGAAYLSSLIDGVPRYHSVAAWAKVVKSKSIKRALKRAAAEIDRLSTENEDHDVLVDNALAEVLKVSERSQSGTGFKDPVTSLKAAYKHLEVYSQGGIFGVPTGITELDSITHGLVAPDLVVIAGRPGMGKTAAAVTIASHAAAKGFHVGMVSLEMNHEQVKIRQIAQLAKVNPDSIGTSQERWARVAAQFGPLGEHPFYIDDDPFLTLTKIQARCRKLKAEKGLDLLILDYLQLIQAESKRENRQNEIASVARGLKNLAKILQIPIIALAQLSRDVEKRESKRPVLSDLRESGEIEQAADRVILLYRASQYDKDADKNEAEWILAKNRNGRTKESIPVRYYPEFTLFADPPRSQEI